MTRHALLLK